MPPLDSFLMKQETLEDVGTEFYARYLRSWYERSSKAQYGIVSPSEITTDKEGRWLEQSAPEHGMVPADWQGFQKQLRHWLQLSHNYYVTPEMSVLVTAAADSWKDDETILAEDFPTEHGWMWIPGGIVEIDARGVPMPTSAVLWSMLGDAVTLVFFVDKRHPLDKEYGLGGMSGVSRLTPWCVVRSKIGEPVVRSLSLGMVIPPEMAKEMTIHREGSSVAISFPKGYDPSALKPEIRPDAVMVWLVACLRLMQQTITKVTDTGLPANVRRSLRGKITMRHSHVTIIQYRRAEGARQDQESRRELSHRFLRRGHWRRQPYKNVDGEWDRRRIWIHPTIVGDSKLPLMLRDHVNALVR